MDRRRFGHQPAHSRGWECWVRLAAVLGSNEVAGHRSDPDLDHGRGIRLPLGLSMDCEVFVLSPCSYGLDFPARPEELVAVYVSVAQGGVA